MWEWLCKQLSYPIYLNVGHTDIVYLSRREVDQPQEVEFVFNFEFVMHYFICLTSIGILERATKEKI